MDNTNGINDDIKNYRHQINANIETTFVSNYPSGVDISANGLVKHQNYIFTSLAYNLSIIDVTNPESPTFVSCYNQTLEYVPLTMTLSNELLYVCRRLSWFNHLRYKQSI